MALTPRLEVRQSQSLALTPQLMQSIRLLQLSHLELNAFVEAELMANPLLERDEAGEAPEPVEAPTPVSPFEAPPPAGPAPTADAIAGTYDTEVENVFPEERAPGGRLGGPAGEAPDIDQYVAAEKTLGEHLNDEIGLLLADPAERLIARFLADGLNEAGYLAVETAAVAAQLGASPEAVEAVLAKLQTLEPTGLFARSVGECLALQLAERDRLDPMMQALLAHLDLVAAHDLAGLARAIGCDREDVLDMLAELRRLDPKPGRAFAHGPLDAVVPDVFVREGPAGWLVELNADVLPRVLVNRAYYASVSARARDAGEKTFLVDCLQTANWLTRSLDQRAQTILKVAAEIVRQQDGFLRHGIALLRPMTLKLVADAIGMHESTVSRVTANKYVATPRGLFELKYFFTTALASSRGAADHSAEAVRHRIRQLIEAEPADAILSDDTIAALLNKEQGIDVARRTVAKYREAMHIASSVVRRRQKRLADPVGASRDK